MRSASETPICSYRRGNLVLGKLKTAKAMQWQKKRWYKPGPELEFRQKLSEMSTSSQRLDNSRPALHLLLPNVRKLITGYAFASSSGGGIGLSAYKNDVFFHMTQFLHALPTEDLLWEAADNFNFNILEVPFDFSDIQSVDNIDSRLSRTPSEDAFQEIYFHVAGLLEIRLTTLVRWVQFLYQNRDWFDVLHRFTATSDGEFPRYMPGPKRPRLRYDQSKAANLAGI
jgi:hypothetical protein